MKKKADKDVLPHKHLITNYSTVNGIANDYLDAISQAGPQKRLKRRKDQIHEESECFEEVAIDEALESWEKKVIVIQIYRSHLFKTRLIFKTSRFKAL
jgi:hypothetical protein